MFRMIAGVAVAAAILAAAHGAEETVAGATISPSEILQRAQERYRQSGVIRASVRLDATHPSVYTSDIKLLTAPDGRQRAEISTTMREDTWKSLQVVSDGVVWTEVSTPGGPMVTKIDLRKVQQSLPAAGGGFRTLPMLGATGLFDLSSFAALLDFVDAREAALGESRTYLLAGTLKEQFRAGDDALPAAARRFYETARIWLDGDTFLPRRIELGGTPEAPYLRFDFGAVEVNVAAGDDAFAYAAPVGVTVVDRTQWAVAELAGGQAQ